jgi:hypothetical protein
MLLLLAFAALAAGHAAQRPHLVFLLADDQVRLRCRSIANGIKRCSKKLKKNVNAKTSCEPRHTCTHVVWPCPRPCSARTTLSCMAFALELSALPPFQKARLEACEGFTSGMYAVISDRMKLCAPFCHRKWNACQLSPCTCHHECMASSIHNVPACRTRSEWAVNLPWPAVVAAMAC